MTKIARSVPHTFDSGTTLVPDTKEGEASIQWIAADLFAISPPPGESTVVISKYDLDAAEVSGDAIEPAWSNAETIVSAFGLGLLREHAHRILSAIFGVEATLNTTIDFDPDSQGPSLVFELSITRDKRALRHAFVERYAAETVIPVGAPVPVLAWKYLDAASA